MKRIVILIICILCMISFSAMVNETMGQTINKNEATAILQPIISPDLEPTISPELIIDQEPIIDNTDYMAIMISACMSGDIEYGIWACEMRNDKIDQILAVDGECKYNKIDFMELLWLSRISHAEAGGAEWISDDWVMCVGEVVLNRVASPEFPDTIYDVIFQSWQGSYQYSPAATSSFKNLLPNERCIRIAVRLLSGERFMNEPSVVFQAEFTQGSGTFIKFNDSKLGTTYFCISSYPSLYE